MMGWRLAAAVCGALGALNGAVMLLAGPAWHAGVSGLVPLDHYHEHVIADVGAAFVGAGLGLFVRAWRPRWWPVAVATLGFIALHGIVHLSGISGGHMHDSVANLSLFAIPAALAIWAALPMSAKA